MGKKQSKFNFTLKDSLGGISLNDDPGIQKAQQAQALRASQDTLTSSSIIRSSVDFLQHDKEVYDKYLKPGEYGGTPEEVDYKVGDGQSAFKQIVNGVGRLIPLAAAKLAGDVNGMKQAVKYGLDGKAALEEDEIADAIKSWEDQIKEAMPIYATKQYDNGSLLDQMGTAKFWADDLGDGIAHLAAQFVEARLLGGPIGLLGKGASWLGKGVKGAEVLAKVPASAKVANAIANNYKAVTAGLIQSGSTAAIQAQDTAAQIKEGLLGKVNPNTGLEYTEGEIKEIVGTHAANTFNATFLVHTLPAIWESKIFLGLNKAKLGDIRANIMKAVNNGELTITDILKGTGESHLLKKLAKETGKGALEGGAIEGLWEENIEQSIQNYDIQQGLNDKNVSSPERTLNYAMGLLTNLGVKDDAKAVVMGMILGAPMGAVKSRSMANQYNEQMPAFVDSLRSSEDVYRKDIDSLYKKHPENVLDAEGAIKHNKGEIILDENGEPIHDIEALKNLTYQIINQKNQYDRQVVSTLTGNTDMAQLNENIALSAAVHRELGYLGEDENTDGALDFLKWRIKQQLKEQAEAGKIPSEAADQARENAATVGKEEDAGTQMEAEKAATEAKSESAQFNGKDRADLSKVINENMAKLDSMAKSFKDAQEQSKPLIKFGQDAERNRFNSVIEKGLFYEDVKRKSFDQMVQDREEAMKKPLANIDKIAKEIEAINRLKEDSLNKSKAYLNNTEDVYKAWAGPREKYNIVGKELNERTAELLEEKDPGKAEELKRKVDTLRYQHQEMGASEGFKVNDAMFNEELISTPINERVNKPIGTRNKFYYQAANDYSKLAALNDKVTAYEKGETSLMDVLTYAKESITHMDDETATRLNDLVQKESEKLEEVNADLAQMDEFLYDDLGLPEGSNPEYIEALKKQEELERSVAEGKELMAAKQEAAELNLINNKPENIEKFLIEDHANSFFTKGKLVISNAVDDGVIREEYDNLSKVDQAIEDLIFMRNSMEDRLDTGDLKGVPGLTYLIGDADAMIAQLRAIRESIMINKANRDAQQVRLNKEESMGLMEALGHNGDAVVDPDVFRIANDILGGNLEKMIQDIHSLEEYHYEGTMALLHLVQSKANAAQLKELSEALDSVKSSAAQSVVNLHTPGATAFDANKLNSFRINPRQLFPTIWQQLSRNPSTDGFPAIANNKGNLFNKFLKNNNIDEIISKAEDLAPDAPDLGMAPATFIELAKAYKAAVFAEKLQDMLSTPIKPLVKGELADAADAELTPTTQQNISIREGISWLKSNTDGNSPFKGWGFLRGIAGTGKTNIVLRWILSNSGIDKADIMSTALTSAATEVVGRSTGTKAMTFKELAGQEIPSNVKLIILDEYATIGVYELKQFEKRIADLKAAGQDIKVLILGDPTQITPRGATNEDINEVATNEFASNIKIINPLTVVYRSDVTAVNDASDKFQDNNKPVDNLTVSADRPMHIPLAIGVHTSSAAGQIFELIAANIKAEEDQGKPARSRAIIVGTEEDKAKYQGLGADVMTVYEAQSRTYDEVYVDIQQGSFKDTSTFNTAMYTAASRAKVYSFLTYSKGEVVVDTDLALQLASTLDKLAAAKGSFIKAKTAELAMIDGLDKGSGIRETMKDKEVKKTVEKAGKDPLDKDDDEGYEGEDEAVPEDGNEDGDVPVNPAPQGPVNPDSGETVSPMAPEVPITGQKSVVNNVDKEAHKALNEGLIGPGSEVIYVYHEMKSSKDSLPVVSIMAKGTDGKWVRTGVIFNDEIQEDPALRSKIAGKEPFYTDETDIFNGRRTNDVPFTTEQLAKYTVGNGTISSANPLAFQYASKANGLKALVGNIAKQLSSLFKSKFYHKSQADKADKVIYRIFTKTMISKDSNYDGTFKPKPGIPYAIIGSDGKSYKNAMFVQLQANNMEMGDPQIVALKRFSDSVETIQKLAGISMGTSAFNNLIRVFRNSLEIVDEQGPTGFTKVVKIKNGYNKDSMIADAEALFTADKQKGDPDLLKNVKEEHYQDVLKAVQNAAMDIYGITTNDGLYTQAEIDEMGEEYVAVAPNKTKFRKGEALFYAQNKSSNKKSFKKTYELSSNNGKAQLAFDQIARANEFAGGFRIRVARYMTNKSRGKSYKGKSLIAKDGGSTKVYNFLELAAAHLINDDQLNKEERIAEVRELIKNEGGKVAYKQGEDPVITFLKAELEALGNPAITKAANDIYGSKETPVVTLDTLKSMTGEENYPDGKHLTKEEHYIKNEQTGEVSKSQTYLRKPLAIEEFNKLGDDPETNQDKLQELVHTNFSTVQPTRITIDLKEAAPPANLTPPGPIPGAPAPVVLEAFEEIDAEIELLQKALPGLTGIAKLLAVKKIKALEDSKGRSAYDLESDRPAPGKRVNRVAAIAELRRLLPGITDAEMAFVNKAVMAQMANPGEKLLGLFDKGKIYLEANEDGDVYDKVLRHEVMHKIFNEFLTKGQQEALRKEVDPGGDMTTAELDEYLADQFMNYQRPGSGVTFGDKLKAFFEKLMNFFGIYTANKDVMHTIFNQIEDGKFTKNVGGLVNVRRAFSDIKRDFGNVNNYKQAVKVIEGLVRDAVITTDLTKSPLTMKEAKQFIKETLTKKINTLTTLIEASKEGLSTVTEEERVANAEFIAETQRDLDDANAELALVKTLFKKGGAVLNQIWKDMYPNYKFRDGDAVLSFEEDADILPDETSGSSIMEFTKQSDEKNNEGKLTENVKNFLSFIYKTDGKETVRMMDNNGEYKDTIVDKIKKINPRYAYLECLRNLNGLVSGEGNLKDQIIAAAAANGISMTGNSDGRVVIKYILNLIDDATSPTMIDPNGMQVTLPTNMRFFGEDKFVMAKGDISTSSESDFKYGVERNKGESTPAFIQRIVATGLLSKAEAIGLFKQAQAQETMRDVMSNFLSQREGSYMIAEASRVGSMGNSQTELRYFDAQLYGAERVVANDIEAAIKKSWLGIPVATWTAFDKGKTDNEKLGIFFKALGLSADLSGMNLGAVGDILENIKAFKHRVELSYKNGVDPSVIKNDSNNELDAEVTELKYYDLEHLLTTESKLINNITKILTRNSADARPSKYRDVNGETRYTFHNSNQAVETMERVIKATMGQDVVTESDQAKRNELLPKHLRTAWARFNPFINGKLNKIYRILDHDGMRTEGYEEFATRYSDESVKDNLQRQFAYGFMGFLKANNSTSMKNLKYVQFFYTISNRPRMMGAEIDVLRDAELRQGGMRMLLQHLSQPDLPSVKTYNKMRTTNMEELGKAIEAVWGKRTPELYAKLLEDYKKNASQVNTLEPVIDKFMENLNVLADKVAQRVVAEKVLIGDNARSISTILKDKGYVDKDSEAPEYMQQKRDNVTYTKEQILPMVQSWVANNYINSYFLNQLPVGNYNFFKDSLDMVKRMSGVFGPGIKGLVDKNSKFFMKPKFRAAVISDPKMFSHELSEIFRENDTELYKQLRDNVDENGNEKGFELADGQGFITPSRARNIEAGFGKAYNAGAVFKPAHYEIVERGEEGSGDFAPVMLKYSSVELSDDLVRKFPKLLKLRNEMERMQVDELVFDSVTKTGRPAVSGEVPGLFDDGSGNFAIDESHVLSLSNENYRLQLNPKHDTNSEVATPSQLSYFLNVLSKINTEAAEFNDEAAAQVYQAVGKLIDHGLKKTMGKLTPSGKITVAEIRKTLTGAGNERIMEMLKTLSYNMPNIADKALIQIMNMFSKNTVKIKFKGGKFVLQTAYGVEMIKKGTERYKGLSEAQKAAHDTAWTAYGEQERDKITEQARGLKYGRDSKGRMYAEVLLDKSYADKARVGQFLTPDMMAYRVPSTELHSSIAIMVAGYYDSKGSNVIIAPPELVAQHGSDFDVDALYVIGREFYEKKLAKEGDKEEDDSILNDIKRDPQGGFSPGYNYRSAFNDFEYNPATWVDVIAKLYRKAGTDAAKIKQVDKIYEMYQRNIIVENFLKVISSPLNIKRMAEPISVQVVQDAIVELGLQEDKITDLSNPLDNIEVYNSNFQGLKLVGVFANGIKSLAYMLKAGAGSVKNDFKYPTLQEDKDGNKINRITLDGVTYENFTEALPNGKNIWQVLDALVNTSVDNVKEQQLYKINASGATGNLYVASLSLGIPLIKTVELMLQPTGLLLTKYNGNTADIKDDLLAAYNAAEGSAIESYSDVAVLFNTVAAPTSADMRAMINKPLSELNKTQLLQQVILLREIEKLKTLGQDLNTFSSAVGVVQGMPAVYADIEKKAEDWDKLGTRSNYDDFSTNEKFSFNIDSIFKNQPNILAAYRVFLAAKEVAERSLMKHLPQMRAFVDEILDDTGIKLSFKENKENMKNEVISYLLSSMYSEENRAEVPYAYTYRGKEKIATGKQAWSQRFIERLEMAKAEAAKSDTTDNAFLRKLSVKPSYGVKTLVFSTSSNSDYLDNLEMQEAFEKLSDEGLKQDLVKYAVMNYGLKFGVQNYSMFIPADYLKPVDDYIRKIDSMLRKNKISDGKISAGELFNMKENFMLRLAVNNVDKLPFISGKKMKPVPTPGKQTQVPDDFGGTKLVPALQGMDDVFYTRKYANPADGESGKREFGEKDFPKFIRNGENIALIRLNSPNSDYVYYQKVGMKNWLGGYDASLDALKGGYSIDTYFGEGIIPIAVGDITVSTFPAMNEYLEVGSKVIIHGYNNESRDQGRFAEVTDVLAIDPSNPARRTISVRTIETKKRTLAQANFIARMQPLINMLKGRFNMDIRIVAAEDMPTPGAKGQIRNGVAYISADATWDTAFHEVAHPLIDAIRDKNSVWFNKLLGELRTSERGMALMESVARQYSEYSLEEMETEALVTLLGELADEQSNMPEGLKGLVKRLFRALGDLLRGILKSNGVINLETLGRDEMAALTLNDLASILSNKDANIELDLSSYVKADRDSRELAEVERKLFESGRIILSCKA